MDDLNLLLVGGVQVASQPPQPTDGTRCGGIVPVLTYVRYTPDKVRDTLATNRQGAMLAVVSSGSTIAFQKPTARTRSSGRSSV